jgi:YD repeat-containing protein
MELYRGNHTPNPNSSLWAAKYAYEYQSGQLTVVRHIREDSVTVYTNEYDRQGRLCRIVDHSACAGRTTEKYDYDDAGRKKKTQYVDVANQRLDTLCGVQGTDTCYSAPGTAKLTTLYNDRDQPVELLFHGASDQLVSRVVFTYDAGGNLIEELQTRSPTPLRTFSATCHRNN